MRRRRFLFCFFLVGVVSLATTVLILSLGPPVIAESAGLGLGNTFCGESE
jgi:hypothetical protein